MMMRKREFEKDYLPSDACAKNTQACIRVYDELPVDDQKDIMHMGRKVRIALKKRGSGHSPGLGRLGMIELLGKIGMWMIKDER